MSALKTAVLRQIAYAKSVRSVIRSIMRRMLDGDWINNIFASSDDEFNDKLDEAFKSLDFASATKGDLCKVVAEVLCNEVSRLCLVLKDVCDGSGNGAYYEAHISHERFVRLVLSTDTAKLGRMKRILEDAKLTPIDVLRGMGAILNDEPLEERMALGAKERRIANAELKTLVEETKNAIDNVGAKVDEVDKKVSKLRKGGKKCGKYTDAQLDFCGNIWAKACDVLEIRNSLNTKVSYVATYKFYHRQLENLNVKDADMFKSIIRAYQARELRRRRRENPAAKKEKKVATKPAENGKIQGMKNAVKTTVALALATTCATAAPLRSEAGETPSKAEIRTCQVQGAMSEYGGNGDLPALGYSPPRMSCATMRGSPLCADCRLSSLIIGRRSSDVIGGKSGD